MIRRLRRYKALWVMVLVFVWVFPGRVYAKPVDPYDYTISNVMVAMAQEYGTLRQNTKALVLQVIDGDALKVQLNDSDVVCLVRMAGINTHGNNDALLYITSQLLGREVSLELDDSYRNTSGDRWTPAYIYRNSRLYNRELLKKGMASVDNAYSHYSLYNVFVSDEWWARRLSVGMWETNNTMSTSSSSTGAYSGMYININTATSSQLQSAMKDISASDARAIVRYRENNPYNTIEEIKFSGGLSRKQYNANKYSLIVCTNINTATREELSQLTGISAADARSIVTYRDKTPFTDIRQLYTKDFISEDTFEKIEPYIDLYDNYEIRHNIPNTTADINRDTAEELNKAGSSSSLTLNKARMIVNGLGRGYTYKSMGEIQKLSGISLTDDQINQLADNLTISAGYRPGTAPEFININTANTTALLDIGFNESQARSIRSAQSRRMLSGSSIPFNLGSLDASVTLFTNINATTMTELLSLSEYMTTSFASTLLYEAMEQPFGSFAELEAFFDEQDESVLYGQIKSYIVLR